jgi:hypothetical protein
MLDFLKKHHEGQSDHDLLLHILENQHLIISQNFKIMSAATDLQTLVDQLTASQAALKTSLDSIQSGVSTIVAGIPAGGMTADEVTALKASLTAALATEQANASEASADAAAVAAAQPVAPAAPADPATPAS